MTSEELSDLSVGDVIRFVDDAGDAHDYLIIERRGNRFLDFNVHNGHIGYWYFDDPEDMSIILACDIIKKDIP